MANEVKANPVDFHPEVVKRIDMIFLCTPVIFIQPVVSSFSYPFLANTVIFFGLLIFVCGWAELRQL
jgi:hypothetical protein